MLKEVIPECILYLFSVNVLSALKFGLRQKSENFRHKILTLPDILRQEDVISEVCSLGLLEGVLSEKVKVSHSLIAVGAVGVRVPLYLGQSW